MFVQDTLRHKQIDTGRGSGDHGRRSTPQLDDNGKPYVDERDAKKALATLANQPGERRKEFRMRLLQLTRGNQSSYVNMGQFGQIVYDVFPNVTQLER